MIAFLFFIAFASLLAGLSGTLPAYRDSGDLIAASHTLGVAHPPGYAVYVLLGRGFDTLLHWGNSAYHANLFSALAMAGAAACLYAVAERWFEWSSVSRSTAEKKLCALSASLCFVLTPAAMELGRVAEMYALLALWASLLLLLFFSELPNRRLLAAFLAGLGLAVHPTLIFLAPLFLVGEWNSHEAFRSRRLAASLLFFGVGVSVFLFLPLRAAQSPWLNWGDASSLRGFWRIVTRADYGGLKLHPEQSVFSWTPADIGLQLRAFGNQFLGEWGVWGILAGLLGIYSGWRTPKCRRWTIGLLASYAIAGPGFFVLSNLPWSQATTAPILQPYLVMVSVLWVPFIVGGLAWAMDHLGWLGAIASVAGIVLAFSRAPLIAHREDFYAYDYSRNLLRALPPGAVLFDPDDPTAFGIKMLQATEHRRNDVLLLNFFRTRWGYHQLQKVAPELLPPGEISNAQDLERVLWNYSTHQRPFFAELPQKLGTVPYRARGLVYAVLPADTSEAALARAEMWPAFCVMRGNFKTTDQPDFFTSHLIDYYAAAYSNLGMEESAAHHSEQAIADYRQALAIDPQLSAAYNNWAIIDYERGYLSEAIGLYQAAVKNDPNNPGFQKNLELALAAEKQKAP